MKRQKVINRPNNITFIEKNSYGSTRDYYVLDIAVDASIPFKLVYSQGGCNRTLILFRAVRSPRRSDYTEVVISADHDPNGIIVELL